MPIRTRWLESLWNLIPPHAERFWVKGSQARGPRRVDEWVYHHINGNALYNVHDASFGSFVEAMSRQMPRIHPVLDSYDLALAAGFYDPHCHAMGDARRGCAPVTSIDWRRSHTHLYVYSEFIVNHYDAALEVHDARTAYPCTILVHGNRSIDHSRQSHGKSPHNTVKRAEEQAHYHVRNTKQGKMHIHQATAAGFGFAFILPLLFVVQLYLCRLCCVSRRWRHPSRRSSMRRLTGACA